MPTKLTNHQKNQNQETYNNYMRSVIVLPIIVIIFYVYLNKTNR